MAINLSGTSLQRNICCRGTGGALGRIWIRAASFRHKIWIAPVSNITERLCWDLRVTGGKHSAAVQEQCQSEGILTFRSCFGLNPAQPSQAECWRFVCDGRCGDCPDSLHAAGAASDSGSSEGTGNLSPCQCSRLGEILLQMELRHARFKSRLRTTAEAKVWN